MTWEEALIGCSGVLLPSVSCRWGWWITPAWYSAQIAELVRTFSPSPLCSGDQSSDKRFIASFPTCCPPTSSPGAFLPNCLCGLMWNFICVCDFYFFSPLRVHLFYFAFTLKQKRSIGFLITATLLWNVSTGKVCWEKVWDKLQKTFSSNSLFKNLV